MELMEYLEIACVRAGNLRLDFPNERQLAALVTAWEDGSNHQILFLHARDFGAAYGESEYASMVASSDLVLPAEKTVSDLVRARGGDPSARIMRRVSVPLAHRAYVASLEPAEKEDPPAFYPPLKTLSVVLSALEQRNGSVFLIGGKAPTLQAAERNVRSTFPGLRLVGRAPGDYRDEDEAGIMSALQKSTPDIIIAGSLLEEGELWVPRHMRYTRSGIFFYSNPIIEVLSGRL